MDKRNRRGVLGVITVAALIVLMGPRLCSLETNEQARIRRNQEAFEREQERKLLPRTDPKAQQEELDRLWEKVR